MLRGHWFRVAWALCMMWGMESSKAGRKKSKRAVLKIIREDRYNPHETDQAHLLEGAVLATFWQRAAAFAIDFLVVLAVYIPAELAQHYFELKAARHPFHVALNFSLHDFEDLIWLVVYAGLCVWLTNGLTLGKRLLHIRVVSLERPKISLWQAVERALGYGASMLEGGLGFIGFFLHPNHQCVHDRIAETIVVKEKR